MSKLEELIEELCPDGVEYKRLDEVFEQFSGMTGVSNKWADEGNCAFIDYMNAYTNLKIDVMAIKLATVNNLNQKTLKKGDVLFTSASETPDECAIASEIEDDIKDSVFMDDHLFGFRVKDEYKAHIATGYLKYAFRAAAFRAQVFKVVRGVTRFYISKTDFIKLIIPIPPLPIQEEIVRILDNFTELTAELTVELTAELTARKKQYEYYRDSLLTFGDHDCRQAGGVEWKTLGEVAQYSKDRISATEVDENTYVGVENLLQDKKGKTTSSYVPIDGRLTKYHKNDVLIGNIRPYLKKIWFATNDGGTNGDVLVVQTTSNDILPKFLHILLSSEQFFNYDMQNAKGAKMPRGDKNTVMHYPIPVPALAEQERIVAILDRFDTIVADITTVLPAEIEARKQQYEYYRDKLLTFPVCPQSREELDI